jgi:hypothetical protein
MADPTHSQPDSSAKNPPANNATTESPEGPEGHFSQEKPDGTTGKAKQTSKGYALDRLVLMSNTQAFNRTKEKADKHAGEGTKEQRALVDIPYRREWVSRRPSRQTTEQAGTSKEH